MPFRNIFGQEHAIGLIKQAILRDMMPHSWLFTGQANIGKFKTAVALTQKLNCKKFVEDACGECDYCSQIAEQTFLDFHVITPEGNFITIDKIRKSLNWLQLHPDRAKKRVMVLDGAEHMGHEASNAFLKTLEEPTPHTLLILIAESTQHLPETIVSRCQQIQFRSLSEKNIERILRMNTDLTSENIHFLNAFSMGSVNENLIVRLEIMKNIQQTAICWLNDFSAMNLEEMLRKCETWGKSKNEEWSLFLNFLETWFRDLTWILHGLPEEKVINRTIYSEDSRNLELRNSAKYFNAQQINEIFSRIVKSRRSIELKANKSLSLESLCLYISRSASCKIK